MKKLFALLLLTTLFISCSDNDDSPTAQLNGKWKMYSYNPGTYQYEEGEITWEFSENGKKLQITNSTQQATPEGLPATGTYETAITNEQMIIGNEVYYYGKGEVTLIVSKSPDNSNTMAFTRMYEVH